MADMAITSSATNEEIDPPPLPAGRLEIEVTAEQVASFAERGYVELGRISTDEELEWIGHVYDQFFEEGIGGSPGPYLEPTRPYGAEPLGLDSPLSQALMPEIRIPELRETNF